MSLAEVCFGYTGSSDSAVTDVSVGLKAGRITALIGPNAAGKSTLLRLMLGEHAPRGGQIMLADRLLSTYSPAQRAALMSYVPQRGRANFAFTVEQVVRLGRYAVGRDDVVVERALEKTDLIALRDRVYLELSVGQQQRVLLARALAQCGDHGRVMLLDEPSSAMDLWHVHQLMTLLGEQSQRGVAVLVVMHDLNLAMRYADEVWLMANGRLLNAGAWNVVMDPTVLSEIYRRPMRWAQVDEARPMLVVG